MNRDEALALADSGARQEDRRVKILIEVRKYNASNFRGARFACKKEGVPKQEFPYDHALDFLPNVVSAAKQYAVSNGFIVHGEVFAGCLPYNRDPGYAVVLEVA